MAQKIVKKDLKAGANGISRARVDEEEEEKFREDEKKAGKAKDVQHNKK